ncbi:Major facilitator superfamily transporter [Cordyceps militaris]|uniref:Major facilitator superfamily transporter n=1 Tax=Cordyceps militaris TaxID=73501 RepID=A0A2H4SNI8_CORMI|nr:Major facilitator superfamily transporter [Cordyceps militaris]
MDDKITPAGTADPSDNEKQQIENVEYTGHDAGATSTTAAYTGLAAVAAAHGLQIPHNMDPARRAVVEKSLKRKLDARCSLFVLIYIMNYLDRNNLAAARLKGLQEDLRLDDTQYATCLSILYVGYILMQVPSNMFINRIQRPSLYIAGAMLLWGVISTLSGNAQGFGSMVAIRFLLGFIEAAFLPGALLILSKWYTRRELTKRNALLFCGNLISNAFSALVGAGVLSNMNGVLGHPAWRWLFWIEGAATCAIAIAAAFILPDLPHNTRGFTEEECLVAQLRIVEDVGELDTDANMGPTEGLKMALKDVKIYVMMLTFTSYVVGLSFNAFFPSLTQTLGFSYVPTLLMSAPPWVFACFVSYAVAWNSDRTQERFWHIVCPMLVGIVGFVICMSTSNVPARYIALFLQTSSYAGYIVFYSWIASSFPRPPAKRAVAIAIINAFAQLGNVAGSYVWSLKEHGYRKSYAIVLSMFGVTIFGAWIVRLMLISLNKQLEKSEAAADEAEAASTSGGAAGAVQILNSPDEALQMRKGFRYLV